MNGHFFRDSEGTCGESREHLSYNNGFIDSKIVFISRMYFFIQRTNLSSSLTVQWKKSRKYLSWNTENNQVYICELICLQRFRRNVCGKPGSPLLTINVIVHSGVVSNNYD